jgi:hypothetical protein
LETFLDEESNVVPYYISARIGNKELEYFISDFLNPDEMVLAFINDVMISENHNRFLYAHNSSNFDGIVVLKTLMNTSHKQDYKFKTYPQWGK